MAGTKKQERIFSPLKGVLQPDAFYRELGLRSGLEIHQQLLTEKKLFCHCPAGIYTSEHDAVILRHMRPTLSELGEYDGTALMEFKTKKEIMYLLKRENVCTYEMDDTPPFMMNQEALDIGLELSLLSKCQIANEIHVIRKQYLDGSIPTGFQRTAILGVNGQIPYKGRTVDVLQISLEEDSCREVFDHRHRITFRTDRLSMPLTETVTGPDMRTPQEVAEVCRLIGRLARVTGKVRRGIGSARQDVNVSVEGGRRVEIKGVSRIAYIPLLVHNEGMRQSRLLGIREHLRSLGLSDEAMQGGSHHVTDFFQKSSSPRLRQAAHEGEVIRLQVIKGARGVLRAFTQPKLQFAQELSGRIRVIACLDEPVNLFIRGEKYGFGLARLCWNETNASLWEGPSAQEWTRLAKSVKASEEDGLVLVWGNEEDTQTAAREIHARMVESLEGVPPETRMPFPDGQTDFERILPGPNRMYPDTDLPPLALTDKKVKTIASNLPDLPWVREERLRAMQLPERWVQEMTVSPHYFLFEKLLRHKPSSSEVRLLVWVFLELLKSLHRKKAPVEKLSESDLCYVLELALKKQIYREGIPLVLERLARMRASVVPTELDQETVEVRVRAILEEEFPAYAPLPEKIEISPATLSKLFKKWREKSFPGEAQRIRALMRKAISHYRGLVSGPEILSAVEKWGVKHPMPTEKSKVVEIKNKLKAR